MSTNLYKNIKQHAIPSDPKDLVTKEFVEKVINRKFKDNVTVVMTEDFAAAYDVTAKTLTQTTPETLIIDGVTVSEGDRILLAGQTDATQNGIYVLTSVGDESTNAVLTRAEDFDESSDIIPNCIIAVMRGDQNHDTQWWLVNDTIATLDSTSLTFTKYPGTEGAVKKFATTISGDGSAMSFQISHGLNSKEPIVQVYDHVTNEQAIFGVEITSTNVVTIKSDVVLTTTESFDVVVMA